MFFERFQAGRRAVLLHVRQGDDGDGDAAEFGELARSAGVETARTLFARPRTLHARALIGAGKVQELRQVVAALKADLVLADCDLSPAQQRNLEQALECRVMTRTELILGIFADRARTFEGKLQVELAQLKHAQTRLSGGWTHLDRQKGGIGLRGVGEAQIELDRRLLGKRIETLQAKLGQLASRRRRGRARRDRSGALTVSLAGYANAGKSTLFNALAAADVVVQDRPFATLDPTMRKLRVPGMGPVVLADTVGFVARLPHALMDAFRATLEEVANADLILHVLDASAPGLERRRREVEKVLAEIGAGQAPMLTVLNKCDLLDGGQTDGFPDAEDASPIAAWPLPGCAPPRSGERGASLRISAKTGRGLEALMAAIGAALGVRPPMELRLPASARRMRAQLYEAGAVLGEQPAKDGGSLLRVRADHRLLSQFPLWEFAADTG